MSNLQEVLGYPDTITREDAIRITTNWRSYVTNNQKAPNPDYIRAFEIPLVDLLNSSAITQRFGGSAVRAYIGLDVENDPSSVKLAIVPIDARGNDILAVPEGTDRIAVEEESTIFDFTNPCPQACDLNSPLFGP
jgi:hypothetical protein